MRRVAAATNSPRHIRKRRRYSQASWSKNCLAYFMPETLKVRFRPESPVARRLDIPADAIGTVICRYRILRKGAYAPDRLDVQFDQQRVAWAVPENEFEVILRNV
jgi:hypothetical protein